MDPILQVLLTATLEEPWDDWYQVTRLALADLMEERGLSGADQVRRERAGGELQTNLGGVYLRHVEVDAGMTDWLYLLLRRSGIAEWVPFWQAAIQAGPRDVHVREQPIYDARDIMMRAQGMTTNVLLTIVVYDPVLDRLATHEYTLSLDLARRACRRRVLDHFPAFNSGQPTTAADPGA